MKRVFPLAVLLVVLLASPLRAADRYAIVITGASGDATYATRYDEWRSRLVTALAERLAFGRDHVVALGERAAPGVELASAENVRRAIAALAGRMHSRDLLLVVLIGHGTYDGTIAKFNLPGPDLDASEWATVFKGVPGQLVVVNTASASFPFLAALSARGRVVVTATDSRAARYDTVFPEYFVKALEAASADGSRVGRLSIWEVFATATAGVRRYYEEKGLLPVEHALLDDAGDGFGKDAEQPGIDTSIARSVLLTADAADRAGDAATRELAARRDDLLAAIEKLKATKATMTSEQYEAELEKLLVDLAKVSRELRAKVNGTN